MGYVSFFKEVCFGGGFGLLFIPFFLEVCFGGGFWAIDYFFIMFFENDLISDPWFVLGAFAFVWL